MLQGHPGWSNKEGGVPMSNKPERVFQHGGVKAAIFTNEHEKDGESFTKKSISVQRVYRDKEGTFKTTNNLYVNDLPKAILVLQKAFDYLTIKHEPEDVSTSS
jgi:hypothetical protein